MKQDEEEDEEEDKEEDEEKEDEVEEDKEEDEEEEDEEEEDKEEEDEQEQDKEDKEEEDEEGEEEEEEEDEEEEEEKDKEEEDEEEEDTEDIVCGLFVDCKCLVIVGVELNLYWSCTSTDLYSLVLAQSLSNRRECSTVFCVIVRNRLYSTSTTQHQSMINSIIHETDRIYKQTNTRSLDPVFIFNHFPFRIIKLLKK